MGVFFERMQRMRVWRDITAYPITDDHCVRVIDYLASPSFAQGSARNASTREKAGRTRQDKKIAPLRRLFMAKKQGLPNTQHHFIIVTPTKDDPQPRMK